MAELIRRGGDWNGKQLVSADWIAALHTPCAVYAQYGLLWWLNTDREYYPSVPASSFFASGAGTNLVWIDPALGLTAVIRWIDQKKIDAFLGRVMASLV